MSDIKSNHTDKTENAKKEDGRVRYTKMRIRSAFYELLQKTGYEKITVTSICTLAEINRATFYKHYLDVPNLVDELQKDAVNELKSKLQNAKDTSFDISVAQTLKYIRENITDSPSIKHLIYPNSSGFTSKISDMLYEMFSNSMSPYENLSSGITKDILFSYISAGSAGIIENWCKSGYKESEEDIAHSIIFLASTTLKNVRS
jgi:AcrR family transcriptional regulator